MFLQPVFRRFIDSPLIFLLELAVGLPAGPSPEHTGVLLPAVARGVHDRLVAWTRHLPTPVADPAEANPVLQVVRVEGHTDARGPDDYNQSLSQQRAESVKRWLVEYGGIVAERITTLGFGESQSLALNQRDDGSDDPTGRQQNRRVEIVVEKVVR